MEDEIRTVKTFISYHKKDNPNDWFLMCAASNTEDESYLEIYNKLISGEYGECRDGEVEISGYDSKSGIRMIFNYDI